LIPGWLKSFVGWIVSLFVHEAVEQVKEEIQKPSTITDEKVPDKLRAALDADLRERLRDKHDGN
jgi:hypothetical protein